MKILSLKDSTVGFSCKHDNFMSPKSAASHVLQLPSLTNRKILSKQNEIFFNEMGKKYKIVLQLKGSMYEAKVIVRLVHRNNQYFSRKKNLI